MFAKKNYRDVAGNKTSGISECALQYQIKPCFVSIKLRKGSALSQTKCWRDAVTSVNLQSYCWCNHSRARLYCGRWYHVISTWPSLHSEVSVNMK